MDEKDSGFRRSRLRFMISSPLLLLGGQPILCDLVHENRLPLVGLGSSRSRATIHQKDRGRGALRWKRHHRANLHACRSKFMLCGTPADGFHWAAAPLTCLRGTCGMESTGACPDAAISCSRGPDQPRARARAR